MPIPATSQSVAAVVRPRTDNPWRMMAPAPRKPIPLTICAAIRVGSVRTSTPPLVTNSLNPYAETSVKSADPTQTTRCVRNPACRSRSSRSRPMAPPSAAATKRRSSPSAQPIVAAPTTALRELTRDRLCLQRRDLADPGGRELEQLVERLARERVALGGRLKFEQAGGARHHERH